MIGRIDEMSALAVLRLLVLCSAAYAQWAFAQKPPLTWRVDSVPSLVIADDGSPATQFTRVVGAVRLPNGDVVIADGGTGELRVFARQGRFLRNLSRAGAGPGEFQGLTRLMRSGDTIVAFEGMPAPPRVQRFRAEVGRVDGSLIIAGQPRRLWSAVGVLASGELVATPGTFATVVPPAPGMVSRDSITVAILSLVDSSVAWTRVFPNVEFVGFRLSVGPTSSTLTRHILGPSLSLAVSTDRLWACDSGTGRCEAYGRNGKRIGTYNVPFPPRPLDAAAIDRARRSALDAATGEDARNRIDAIYSPAVRPKAAPRFASTVAGINGELWLEAFSEESTSPRKFIVIAPDGATTGQVTIPRALTICEVGAEYVLGVEIGADGLPRIVELRLYR